MKLSEAIRLGSMLRPQAFGDYMTGGGSCAMGAAAQACGLKPNAASMSMAAFESAIDVAFPPVACPKSECGLHRRNITNLVVHLNDAHRWTREQIADWVEGVEIAQEQSVAVPVAVMA